MNKGNPAMLVRRLWTRRRFLITTKMLDSMYFSVNVFENFSSFLANKFCSNKGDPALLVAGLWTTIELDSDPA